MPLDITKELDLQIYQRFLEKEQPWIRVLVNAAGYGIMGHVSDIDSEEL